MDMGCHVTLLDKDRMLKISRKQKTPLAPFPSCVKIIAALIQLIEKTNNPRGVGMWPSEMGLNHMSHVGLLRPRICMLVFINGYHL